MLWVTEQFLYSPLLHDTALIHHHRTIGHFGHHTQVMGNKYHTHLLRLLQFPDQLQNGLLHGYIQSRGGFIANE
jgi:hypothetical protein